MGCLLSMILGSVSMSARRRGSIEKTHLALASAHATSPSPLSLTTKLATA